VSTEVRWGLLGQAWAASTDALVIADAGLPDMPLVYVNPAFERLTGYRAKDVLGPNCRFLQRGGSGQLGLAVVRAALEEAGSGVVTLRSYRKDTSPFWNELSLTPMRDRAGRVSHFLGKLTDVSARVIAEQKLVERHRRLLASKRALEDLARKDGLTGLYNRRAFDEQLEREWNRARRDHTVLSLLMIDIDHFKRFNDTYGHLAGDRCIQTVADAVKRCFARGSDLAARYGGDEFVVLAAGTDRKHARARGERLRHAISALAFEHAVGSRTASVSVCVGLATAVPHTSLLPDHLLIAADRALYQAKRQGRDRLVQMPPLTALASAA
jgi:diguanylate cyclase (GGDEF)-like protein/PAS domain S-box-containing protein